MPDPVLTLLKYVLLAVLYLFFLRVLRAVWVEVREPPPAVPPEGPPAAVDQSRSAHAEGALGARDLRTGAGADNGAERLVVVSPPESKGAQFEVGPEATVGRAGGCAVLLEDDSFVSQLHARLFHRGGDLWVEDLGSTNGTYLNGNRVTGPAVVRRGDRIQFGRTTMELAS